MKNSLNFDTYLFGGWVIFRENDNSFLPIVCQYRIFVYIDMILIFSPCCAFFSVSAIFLPNFRHSAGAFFRRMRSIYILKNVERNIKRKSKKYSKRAKESHFVKVKNPKRENHLIKEKATEN